MTLAITGVDWCAARAGGVVAYVLLTTVIILGLALAGKERLRNWPRFAVEDVHRFGGLLAGCFIWLHAVTIVVDSQANVSLVQAVVPFTSGYRPLWTGLGTVAAEFLLSLALANRYRRRISYSLWRRLHYLNFAIWLLATWHGIGAGTDSVAPWLLAIYFSAIVAVSALILRRAARGEVRITA